MFETNILYKYSVIAYSYIYVNPEGVQVYSTFISASKTDIISGCPKEYHAGLKLYGSVIS